MQRSIHAIPLLLTLLLPVTAFAADEAPKLQWGKTEETATKMRTQLEGASTYYEPEAVKKDGSVVYVRVYNNYDPRTKEAGTDYAINCETQEMASASGGKWGAPARILGGEAMFAFAKKQCDWGPGWFTKAYKAVVE